jgi:hypothetical protein
MSTGQYRVLVLLIVLAVLESIANTNVKAAFKTSWVSISSKIGGKT